MEAWQVERKWVVRLFGNIDNLMLSTENRVGNSRPTNCKRQNWAERIQQSHSRCQNRKMEAWQAERNWVVRLFDNIDNLVLSAENRVWNSHQTNCKRQNWAERIQQSFLRFHHRTREAWQAERNWVVRLFDSTDNFILRLKIEFKLATWTNCKRQNWAEISHRAFQSCQKPRKKLR